MGCPEIYYKKALKLCARNLNIFKNKQKAEKLYNEENTNVLEEEINKQREEMSTEEFYFEAGEVSGMVLQESNTEDGCDGFNACLGGLDMFEEFILGDEDKQPNTKTNLWSESRGILMTEDKKCVLRGCDKYSQILTLVDEKTKYKIKQWRSSKNLERYVDFRRLLVSDKVKELYGLDNSCYNEEKVGKLISVKVEATYKIK